MSLQRAPLTAIDPTLLLVFLSQDPLENRHVIDLGYRLCSPSAQLPENTGVWSLPNGEVAGFAIIQREFWTIDYGISSAHPELFSEILGWANQRMKVIATEEHERYPDGLMNFIDCFDDDRAHQTQLEASGYRKFASWSQVHRWQALNGDLPSLAPLDSFVVRPVAGAEELAACAALQRLAFDSTNMSTDWRMRLPKALNYMPDLDLVMVRPTGELVAFCLGWQMADQGQIEPLGVHPDFQRHGLGRVMLRACLQRMKKRGIAAVHIEHNGENDLAAELYVAEGFGHPRKVGKFMRRWHATA